MPALPLSQIVLWTTGPILHLLCVYLIYRRKLLPQFKFFASLLAFQAVKSVFLFFLFRRSAQDPWLYYYGYWVTTAMADMATIPVLYEIFCAAFKPFAGLQDLVKVVFKWAAAATLMIGLLVFLSSPTTTPGHGSGYWIASSIHDFGRIVRVMQCALLMFLFMGSQHLGVNWRNRVFGFALGLGVVAFCQLLVYSALVNSHISKVPMLQKLAPEAYYLALLIWVAYLAVPAPAREALHIPVASPLLRWNEVALALGHSGGQVAINTSAEPFMPSVERMVEQVMQKEMIADRRQRAF
jgi:hypothetical protein